VRSSSRFATPAGESGGRKRGLKDRRIRNIKNSHMDFWPRKEATDGKKKKNDVFIAKREELEGGRGGEQGVEVTRSECRANKEENLGLSEVTPGVEKWGRKSLGKTKGEQGHRLNQK